MRPRGTTSPKTPAERQRLCRALKRGEKVYADVTCDTPSHMTPPKWDRIKKSLAATAARPTLPGPAAVPALPAPQTTAIERSAPAAMATPRKGKAHRADDAWRLTLRPAVAARLQSLLDRHNAGQSLTAAERAEAQGLLDIAEFFIFHLRQRLAA